MTSRISIDSTLQVCHQCGGGAPVDVHFCPQCQKILSLGRHGDYFAFLDLPRRLAIDSSVIEQRFRTLSRQFHPDYFYGASPGERRASLERASYLNDAYRTLRHPVSRIEYLLELEGVSSKSKTGGDAKLVPPVLLEEVFEWNEKLEELRELRGSGAPTEVWTERLQDTRRGVDTKRANNDARLQQLSADWDALCDAGAPGDERRAVLEELRTRLLERNYITNLLGSIDRELGGQ
jgi:molecular chaperone HscB